MPFLISPGVSVQEIDLTTIVPAVSTTEGALAGDFRWGPCNIPVLVDSEKELVRWFWTPNSRVADDWFTAWNFLNYGNKLYVVRVVDQDNATMGNRAKNATASNTSGILVLNDDVYIHNYRDGSLDTLYDSGPWIAKYPGEMGNSLKVSVCPSADAFESDLTGTVSVTANTTSVTGSGTSFSTQVTIGDLLVIGNETHRVSAISNNTVLTLEMRHHAGASGATATRRWQYYVEVDQPPGTSNYAATKGASNDEIHVVIVDEDGRWTGTPGEILEVYPGLSQASDCKHEDGSSLYYLDVIDRKSLYVRWAAHDGNLTNAGDSVDVDGTTVYDSHTKPLNYSLSGGSDGVVIGNDERIRGYDLFKSVEDIDISLVLGAAANQTIATYLINNVAEPRMDCVVFLSPPRYTVVDNVDEEANDIVTFRNTLPSTSYAFMDSGWKYMYDKWNDIYRYVPLNGDIAGLAVLTDSTRDPWWSFAGLNRGHIKNVTKLAWNPRKADRDILYKNNINPVMIQPGEGCVLWGDKTLLTKPSAFDRINVRRLFIVLEKAISKAAKYSLFEFNDEFTRAQFKNMVEPFLRDVKGRRGLYDFYVVCDDTNNTPERIDRNEFWGDIYIKPARSINFIILNFVAVRTGVEFSEVVGKF